MKKYYYALLALALPTTSLFAQVTNAQDYTAGEQYHEMVCSSPASPAGAAPWAFGGVSDSSSRMLSIYPSTGTNILTSYSGPTNGDSITKTAAKSIQTASPIATYTIQYTPGILLMDRPITNGDMDSLGFTSQVVTGFGTLTGGGMSRISADAVGSLTTPTGTYANCLRVKSSVDNVDSNIILGTIRTKVVSYAWYDGTHKAPLFRVDSTTNVGSGQLAALSGTTVASHYLLVNWPADVNSVSNEAATLKANFNSNGLNISADMEQGKVYTADVFNMSGQKVFNHTFTAVGNTTQLNVSNTLPAGTYIISLMQQGSHFSPAVVKVIK